MPSLGFILLRHVNSQKTDKYWQHSWKCIRKFYPENKIVIIDDNSDKTYLTDVSACYINDASGIDGTLFNTMIINSTYKKRGELLPYYYFFKYKFFNRAVIIHDSVFIQKYIDFGNENKFLWHFEHTWDKPHYEKQILFNLDQCEFLNYFHDSKNLWNGCFGAMSVISYDLLDSMNAKYNMMELLNHIQTREDRMSFERIFAIMFTIENNWEASSIFGNIIEYSQKQKNITINKGLTDEEFEKLKETPTDLSILKIWCGR